jgi:hypothetical protein
LAPLQAAPVVKRASLCTPGETAIFECRTKRRLVAVCGSSTAAQYRSGLPGKLELSSPVRSAGLSYANRPYSGGGESQIRFAKGPYGYVVYSSTIRTSFGAGPNYPAFRSGVLVTRGASVVSRDRCVQPSDAVLDLAAAQRHMPEGTFVEHD